MNKAWITILRESFRTILIIYISIISLTIVIGIYIPTLKIYYPVLYFAAIIAVIDVLVIQYYKLKYELDKDLLFYITYLYALSYATTNIRRLFQIATEEEDRFKAINKIMKKIVEISDKYKYTYPEAIRYIKNYIPKTNFRDFIEKLATAIEIGEDISEFLYREFENQISIYETNYKKSIENIRLLQEVVLSLSSSLAFALATIFFIPFFLDINIIYLLLDFFIIFIASNILIYYISKYYIIDDSLWVKNKDKPLEYKRVYYFLYIILPISILLTILFSKDLPIIAAFALGVLPMSYISYRISLLENKLKNKELVLPEFFSSIIGYSEIYGSNQTKIIDNVRIHDFGSLNEDIERLYKRIVISKDYQNSWYYFISELGSNTADKIIRVFEKVLEYSGDSRKAGDMLYKVLIKINELRNTKAQFISNTKGFFYGTFVAFSSVLFVIYHIMLIMNDLFKSIATALQAVETLGLVVNLYFINISFDILQLYISLLVIIKAIVLSLSLKNIEGTSKLGIFKDLAIMMVIASLLYLVVNYFFVNVVSGLSPIQIKS